jgi:hypothetical protein
MIRGGTSIKELKIMIDTPVKVFICACWTQGYAGVF